MELSDNQSALILSESEDGGIEVNVASPDMSGVTGALCQAIATKLMQDADFQKELMGMMVEAD